VHYLGAQAGKIIVKPHIPMLKENNTRRGFFERNKFEAVRSTLPDHLQPVVTFAYVTGWRIPSEVLKLQWPQVDFLAGEIRLYAGTTKNDDGRVFPLPMNCVGYWKRICGHAGASAKGRLIVRGCFIATGNQFSPSTRHGVPHVISPDCPVPFT
jgi:integrase